MAVDITILVGTMTGTAEMVAQEVQQALETAGHQVTIQVMDGLDASVFQSGSIFLICTSTYGNGDVPDNAQALFSSLETEKPDPEQHHLRRHLRSDWRTRSARVAYASTKSLRNSAPSALAKC